LVVTVKDYPDKYIYSPWTAPSAVQEKAGCVVGKDYPHPIVDDKESKALGIARIRRAYEAKVYGDDPRVFDGTAAEYVRSFGEIDEGSSLGKRKTKEEASDEKKHIKQQKLSF